MAIKIEQQIVGYSVKKDDEDKDEKVDGAEPTKSLERMHEEIKRPAVLLGSTYKIKTPLSDHALYITLNDIVLNSGTEHEQRQPFEIFLNSKNMEHFQWVLALTRVISAVFRKGGDVTFLVDELKQVFDPQGGYFKKGGRFMPSLVAEIGEVIETHMKTIGLIKEEELSEPHRAMLEEKRSQLKDVANSDTMSFPPGSQLCAKCHVEAMILMDGCMTCLNCGESKCS